MISWVKPSSLNFSPAITRAASYDLARELQVVGLMNIQYAIKNDELFIIEVNPRASRTIPFVSKAIGVPLAKLAVRTFSKIASLRVCGGITIAASPECTPANSTCWSMPPISVVSPSEMQSTSSS